MSERRREYVGANAGLRRKARRQVEAALDWLLPRHCLMCGDPSGPENLCPGCRADLPLAPPACAHCGLELEGAHAGVCARCLLKPPPWDCVLPALDYRFPVDVLVQRFKFSRNLACGEVLAQAMVRAVVTATSAEPARKRDGPGAPECIIPVPLHRARLARRSFNQSEMVARYVAQRVGIPVDCRLLRRVRRTSAQSGLDRKARRRNTRGAFHCGQQRVRVRHAVLLDDVMTTGATLEACTRELKRAGVETVSLWVVARAPPP